MSYPEQNHQRRLAIENCLLRLLQQQPFEEITVKDLAERSGFARKTFYYYYPGKQACLESLTDRLIYECNLNVQLLPPNASLLKIYEVRLQYWKDHRDFLECIIRSHLSEFLLGRFLKYMEQEETALREQLRTEKIDCDDDILFFYTTGQIYLLLKWCAEGFPLSAEEMAQKNLRLISQPLIQNTSE